MSAKGLFTRGFTEGEVKQIQATAKKMLLEGKTLMSWNACCGQNHAFGFHKGSCLE